MLCFIHPNEENKKDIMYCVVNYLIQQISFSSQNTNTHTLFSNVFMNKSKTTYWVELLFKKLAMEYMLWI